MILLALCLCVFAALMVLAAHMVGRRDPVPHGIRQLHLTDCAPPCWIGIVPGVTTVADARARIVETYADETGMSGIRDAGFAGRPIYSNVVEVIVDSETFYLYIRMNISELVDGRSEIVRSIGLFETRDDRLAYAPTVGDMLATFGRPQHKISDLGDNGGYNVTLIYPDWSLVFYTSRDRIDFAGVPRIYMGQTDEPPNE